MSVSLDGFIAGPGGEIDWSVPGEEQFRFHTEQLRGIGVHLMGRRLYETMLYWETAAEQPLPPDQLEWAELWKPLPKIVFSSTLDHVQGNARLATESAAQETARLRGEEGKDIAVGGAGLAAELTRVGLIDEYRLFVNPVVLGGGTAYFPPLTDPIALELLETRTFGPGVVYLRYAIVRSRPGSHEHTRRSGATGKG